MNIVKSVIVSTFAALAVSAGAPAFAQHEDNQGERGRAEQGGAEQRGRQGGEDRQRGNERAQERGAGPQQSYHRGDRMPAQERSREYVVNDWRGHHLHAPPRGYHWVQSGDDFVLVAITTGVILELLLNH